MKRIVTGRAARLIGASLSFIWIGLLSADALGRLHTGLGFSRTHRQFVRALDGGAGWFAATTILLGLAIGLVVLFDKTGRRGAGVPTLAFGYIGLSLTLARLPLAGGVCLAMSIASAFAWWWRD